MVQSMSYKEEAVSDGVPSGEFSTHLWRSRSSIGARLGALFMLAAMGAVVGYLGRAVYLATRDSFVAPLILSPDSDVVVANKLKMGDLQVERTRAIAEMESCDTDISAAQTAIERLEQLYKTTASGREWISKVTSHQAWTASVELRALLNQKRLLAAMLQKQIDLTDQARADMQTGVISRADYAREVQTLNQMDLAVLENERARVQSNAMMYEKYLAQQALAQRHGAPLTPDLVVREEQMVRIEMELLRLESDKRAKQTQRRALSERVAEIDQMAAKLKNRPTFRATEQRLDVAFVPYTQIEGVERGAGVYSCVWGMFLCKRVGTVSEIVPGEVTLPDPWGDQARGQYAVLDLDDRDSAKSKSLRVRREHNENRGETRHQPWSVRRPGSVPDGQRQNESASVVPTTRLVHFYLSAK